MLNVKKVLYQIARNIKATINQDTPLGTDLWRILLDQHPADIASLLERLEEIDDKIGLLKALPAEVSFKVFQKLLEPTQSALLVLLDVDHATTMLKHMHTDELTDLFEHLSDEDLEKYLKLLQQKQRTHIISLLNFDPHSAGGRMNSDVITLQKDFTVKTSIELLQRLRPHKELMRKIYVTNIDNVLVGHITLDTLVFNRSDTPLAQVLEKNELHVYVEEDQEEVAKQIMHYDLSSAPVVDKHNHFLGVINYNDVLEIMKEEESEDAYKRFGLSAVEYSYFSTPAWKLIMQRSVWLIGLLMFQSVSSLILGSYDYMIQRYAVLTVFMGMLVGTGGNAGNQSATLVIRGLTTNEMSKRNAFKVIFREFWIALVLGGLLAIAGFVRIYFSKFYDFTTAIAINIALFIIVIISVVSGSIIPLILDSLGIDPAHSAAPFLTTLMDILGVMIYCYVFSLFLG